MSDAEPKYQYSNTEIARLIRNGIDALASVKTQREIAAELGYDKPNTLSMYKRGEAKVPLAILPNLARLLDIDLGRLLRAWLAQAWPGEEAAIARVISPWIVTEDERALLHLVGTYLQNDDPGVSADLLQRLHRRFKS